MIQQLKILLIVKTTILYLSLSVNRIKPYSPLWAIRISNWAISIYSRLLITNCSYPENKKGLTQLIVFHECFSLFIIISMQGALSMIRLTPPVQEQPFQIHSMHRGLLCSHHLKIYLPGRYAEYDRQLPQTAGE